jgi:hypothetical protein
VVVVAIVIMATNVEPEVGRRGRNDPAISHGCIPLGRVGNHPVVQAADANTKGITMGRSPVDGGGAVAPYLDFETDSLVFDLKLQLKLASLFFNLNVYIGQSGAARPQDGGGSIDG